jgi:hypothetical protein
MKRERRAYVLLRSRLVHARVVRGGARHGGGRRGRIGPFSRASRLRLLRLGAQLEPEPVKGYRHCGLLITVTQRSLPDGDTAERWRVAFIKRLLRRCPGASVLWRREIQERGSVHFHFLVFGVGWLPQAWVRQAWGEIVNEPDPVVDVRAVRRGVRGVVGYLAKYMAKVSASLDDSTYLDGHRWWGVVGRGRLPLGIGYLLVLPLSSFYRLRRFCRHLWPGVGGDRERGFTLFCDSVQVLRTCVRCGIMPVAP